MSRQTLLAAALALAAAGQAQAQQPQIDADRKRPVPDYYLTITSTTDPRIRCRILDAGMPATQADLATWHIVLYYGTTNGLGLAITNTASGNGYAEWSATKAQTATTGVFASQVVAYHRTDGRVQEWARGKACFLQNPAAAYIPFTWSTSNGWVTMAQFAAEQTARSAGDAGLTQHVSAVVGASGTVWRAEWQANAASTAGATTDAHVAASDPHGDRAYSATLLSTGTAAAALSAPWSGLTGTPPKLSAATNADWATAAGTATDATARASAADAYTNAEARLPLSWTNGPVAIDAGNTKTNTYGGMVVNLGPRLQQGTGTASGEYSFAGQGSTASGEGSWANYNSTASSIGSWAMYNGVANGDGSWAMKGSFASGEGSWAMYNSTASSDGSWANYFSTASGFGSWAMYSSTASGLGSWAMYGSIASGLGSWAMYLSTASGIGSWAMRGSLASGEGSWAMDGANATNAHAFSWRANSHGDGTFNIGPDGGVNGVYVGNTNLSWFLTHATDPNAVTNGGATVNGYSINNGAAISLTAGDVGALARTGGVLVTEGGGVVGTLNTSKSYTGVGTSTNGAPRIYLGENPSSGDDSAICIGRTLNGSNLFSHALRDESVVTSGGTDTGYASFDAVPTLRGSNHWNHYISFQSRPIVSVSTGNVPIYGFNFYPIINSTNTQVTMLNFSGIGGTGNVAAAYGIVIPAGTFSAAGDAYALLSYDTKAKIYLASTIYAGAGITTTGSLVSREWTPQNDNNTVCGGFGTKTFGGFYGTALGYNAWKSFTGFSSHNTALGTAAGYSQTAGNRNTYLGAYAGYGVTSGSNNIAIGASAGYTQGAGWNDNLVITPYQSASAVAENTNALIVGKFSLAGPASQWLTVNGTLTAAVNAVVKGNLSVGGSATVSSNLTVAGSVFLGPAIDGNRARLFSDGTNLFFVTASLATTNALTSNP